MKRLFAKQSEAAPVLPPLSIDEQLTPPSVGLDGGRSTPSSQLSMAPREAYSIMAAHLFRQARAAGWFADTQPAAVALRIAKGLYCRHAQDKDTASMTPFFDAIAVLNVEVALTVTSNVVHAITRRLGPDATHVSLSPEEHVQVVANMHSLAGARKPQHACFVREQNTLVLWSDRVEDIERHARDIEAKMVQLIWSNATATPASRTASGAASYAASETNGPFSDANRVPSPLATAAAAAAAADFNEKGEMGYEERPTSLQSPFQHGLAVALDMLLCSLLIRGLLVESLLDGNWKRMFLALLVLPMFPVVLFFCDNLVGTIAQLIGPVRQLQQNSRYFSAIAPPHITGELPHVTIQMPVYKEPLHSVLIPTIESLKQAISTYELQGGTASIIVSEDGLLLLDDKQREERIEYFDKNNVAWVARPPHGADFVRKGRFKKASNLNYTCRISLEVEREMQATRPRPSDVIWTDADELQLYHLCLGRVIGKEHALVRAEGNIRFGDIILLVDSDTRVPSDCLLDAASEMTRCPDVGVLQHCSGVMLVTDSYFEKGIGFFTRLINFAISYIVASGDVAPFMGHNAFLRWSAIQEASFVDKEDGVRKIWSESHVSEDFDMALRLIMKGYIVRWATYSKNEFQEGVSLTCDDELNRWQKYSFGCSEMIFHPLWKWVYRGPMTELLRKFLWADGVPTHYKFGACSYIFSYYAIGAAFPLTVALYFVEGWLYPVLDPIFLSSFRVWISVTVIFVAGGNFSHVLCRYRAKVGGLLELTLEHMQWLPFMLVFFGGMPYHVLTALLAHPLGINMSWSATIKDLEDSNFFIELPRTLGRFWRLIGICLALIAGAAVLATDAVPHEWQIASFFTIWPLALCTTCHLLYPIALNPALLRFSF